MTVALKPTWNQLLHSFIWVGLGTLFGLVFLLATVIYGEPNMGAIVIGGVLLVLAVISAVLEYRALPGAIVEVGDQTLTLKPHRGGAVSYEVSDVASIAYFPGEHARRDGSLKSEPALAPTAIEARYEIGRSRGLRRPHWYLTVQPTREAMRRGVRSVSYAVGGDLYLREKMREACQKAGIPLSIEG